MSGITNNVGSRTGLIGQTERGIDHSTICRAYMASGPTVTTTTWTLVPLDTISFDLGNNFTIGSTYKCTIPSSGYYHVNYQLTMYSAYMANFMTKIYTNGSSENHKSAEYRYDALTGDAGLLNLTAASGVMAAHFDSGDYIQLYGYIEERTAIGSSFSTGSNKTFLNIYKISN